MIRSSPLKAPDATKRMLVVSTWTVSPRNFLLFFSGTFTIVPSRSFNKPWAVRHGNKSSSIIRMKRRQKWKCCQNQWWGSSFQVSIQLLSIFSFSLASVDACWSCTDTVATSLLITTFFRLWITLPKVNLCAAFLQLWENYYIRRIIINLLPLTWAGSEDLKALLTLNSTGVQ